MPLLTEARSWLRISDEQRVWTIEPDRSSQPRPQKRCRAAHSASDMPVRFMNS